MGCQVLRLTAAVWCGGILVWLRGENQRPVALIGLTSPLRSKPSRAANGKFRLLPNIIRLTFRLDSMDASDRLKELYNDALAKGPFPTEECGRGITAVVHGELILYLADIAGLASRGEHGLVALSESDKAKFQKLASRGISTRVPGVAMRIDAQGAPELHALIAATERARLLILKALESQLT